MNKTIRSVCGKARATHHPEWSADKPWVTYINGTARRHFETERQAVAYLKGYGGFKFPRGAVMKRRTWSMARIHRPTGNRYVFQIERAALPVWLQRSFATEDGLAVLSLEEAMMLCRYWNRANPSMWHYRVLLTKEQS